MYPVENILNPDAWDVLEAAVIDARHPKDLLLHDLSISSDVACLARVDAYKDFVRLVLIEYRRPSVESEEALRERRKKLVRLCGKIEENFQPDDQHRKNLREILKVLDPSLPSPSHVIDGVEIDLIQVSVNRKDLVVQFLEYAKQNDVVFALGGTGSGLTTFLDQFHDYLENYGFRHIKGVDFDLKAFEAIKGMRERHDEAFGKDEPHSSDYRNLKCLFASLTYSVCQALSKTHSNALRNVIDSVWISGPRSFQEKYFAERAMKGGELRPIVDYFFKTLQKIATATLRGGVIVFMPLETLGSYFTSAERNKPGFGNWGLVWELWKALGAFIGRKGRFDKVCLIIGGSDFPFAHSPYATTLVENSLWCLPPFDDKDAEQLLTQSVSALSGPSAATLLIEATGGSPWLTQIVLSFAVKLARDHASAIDQPTAAKLINESVILAERAITSEGASVGGPLKEEIVKRLKNIRTAFGHGVSDDDSIVAKWTKDDRVRKSGYYIQSQRIEAFVASGLIWLDGTPWDAKLESFIFLDYPKLYFRPPSRLTLATHSLLTDKNMREMG